MTTLLLVDDERLLLDVLSSVLEEEGYRVLRAADGSRALALLRTEAVALVITDYMMPAMTGIQLAEAIQEALGDQAPPIILMSGAHAHLARRRASLLDAVFDKPFRMADLVAQVRMLVGPAD